MTSVTVTWARAHLPEVIERSRAGAVHLQRHGKVEAVLLSPEEYRRLIAALEEAQDITDFDAAIAEGGPTIPWAQVRADLGWQ